MYAVYGNYQHATNEVWVQEFRKDPIFSGGIARGYMQTVILGGMLFADTPSALTTAINALTVAYATQGLNLGIYEDSGAITALSLNSAACIGGTRVIIPPSFSNVRGGQYTTYIYYTVGIEGEVFDPTGSILFWREQLEFSGGGPEYTFLECLTGPPQKQLIRQETTYRAVQTGEAVGYFSYPQFPSPRWPDALLPNLNNSGTQLPKRSGPPGQPTYTEWPIMWQFSFASSSPLIGGPTPWPI